jgi:CheY-like chemotaxis protein
MAGFQVEAVNTRYAFVDTLVARRGAFDLVVLDLMFPEGSALESLSEIRNAGVRTPVLIYTSHRSDHMRLEVAALGAAGYIEKDSRLVGHPFILEVYRALTAQSLADPCKLLFRPIGDRTVRSHVRSLLEDVRTAAEISPASLDFLSRRVARFLAATDLSVPEFEAVLWVFRDTMSGKANGPGAILEHLRQSMIAAAARDARPPDPRVNIVLWRMQAALNRQHRLRAALAAQFAGVDEAELRAILDKTLGVNFQRLVQLMFARRAILDISLTGDDLKQTAMRPGHLYDSGFSREFHRVVGLSPRMFKHLLREPLTR